MLDTIDGLPVHALVVHVVVVVAPLTALLAVVYAVARRRRSGLRLPLVLGAVVTGACGWVAGQSGHRLEARVTGGSPPTELLQRHTQAGELLQPACVAFMVLVLVAVAVLSRLDGGTHGTAHAGGPDGQARTPERSAGQRLLAGTLAGLLVLAAAALTSQTVVTGHAGTKAVWSSIVG